MSAGQSVKRPRATGYQNRIPSKSGEKLYLKSKMADVYFTFRRGNGSTKRVPAHKSWLAAASDVFEAMFYGDLKEEGDIRMVDVSDAAFEEFLQFFYTSRVHLTAENVAEVMGLGHKYNVTECVEVCVQFYKENLTNENTCTSLNVAIFYDQTELLKLCNKHIVVNSSAVLNSADFLACDKRVLGHILGMNLLSCSETEVFEACMSWVMAKSKRNIVSKKMVLAHLGDLFYEIRFKSMTMQQFCALAASYDPVLSTDFKDITNLIAMPEFQPKKFNKNPRQVKWNENAIIKCIRAMDGTEWEVDLDNEEETTFSSNDPLLLGGFVCEKVVILDQYDNSEDLRANLPVEVKVTEASSLGDKSENIVLSMKASLGSKGTEVILTSPILIRPGFFYTIRLSQFPGKHSHYTKQLLTKIPIDSDITIKFHNDSYDRDDGTKKFGLIPVLMFNKI